MTPVEQPYAKREMRYAPAAPFAEAINEWIEQHRKRHRHQRGFQDLKDTRRRQPVQPNQRNRDSGLEELARRAGMPSKSLRRYLTGESAWISIDNADRLAMALNTPLWMLADEFLTLGERREREKAAA